MKKDKTTSETLDLKSIEELRDENRQLRQKIVEMTTTEGRLRVIARTAQSTQLRFAQIIDGFPNPIISTNEKQEIVLFNVAAVEKFGFDPYEVLGKPIDLLIPDRYHENHKKWMNRFAEEYRERSREMNVDRPVFVRRKDGTEFPVSASISKCESEGKIFFTVMLHSD